MAIGFSRTPPWQQFEHLVLGVVTSHLVGFGEQKSDDPAGLVVATQDFRPSARNCGSARRAPPRVLRLGG